MQNALKDRKSIVKSLIPFHALACFSSFSRTSGRGLDGGRGIATRAPVGVGVFLGAPILAGNAGWISPNSLNMSPRSGTV